MAILRLGSARHLSVLLMSPPLGSFIAATETRSLALADFGAGISEVVRRRIPNYRSFSIFLLGRFMSIQDGFGGLLVSMLASGTQVCGFKPGRSRWIFTDVKILSMPSSGGEVKASVQCPSFVACKRT